MKENAEVAEVGTPRARWASPVLALCFLGAATLCLVLWRIVWSETGGGVTSFSNLSLKLLALGAFMTAWELGSSAGRPWSLAWPRFLAQERVRSLGRHVLVAMQLALLVLVIGRFRLESPVFYEEIGPLVLIGFAIHAALPMRQRLGFFVLLSLAGILLVFGFRGSVALVTIGAALIALCHLPVAFGLRVALLLAAGAVLAVMRADLLPSAVPGAVWPILGSMFMFRLVAYMYDLRHARERPELRRTLAYFFLLPNVAFPLFPVVDYGTFRRTYYDQDAVRIYQRGIEWILHGVVHLLLYRLVYQYLMIPVSEVADAPSLMRHLVSNFLLYLRVSGQFHVIVGILHLFGFRLPRTHHFFFLASSFTDFWRRINIFWKDFMMKVVYYPAFFRLRRFGTTLGIVLATVIVFFGTWLLHAYQWFWLLGGVLLTVPDMLFWGILAVLLVANTLSESRKKRARPSGAAPTLRERAVHAVRVAATFTAICVLWSLWSSETVAEWLHMWRSALEGSGSALRLVGALGAFAAAAVVTAAAALAFAGDRRRPSEPWSFRSDAVLTLWMLAAMLTVGSQQFAERIGGRGAEIVRDLRVPQLSQRDAEAMQRGYYENLTGVNRTNGALWNAYGRRPSRSEWPNPLEAGIVRETHDFGRWELVPFLGTIYHGAPFRTNQWGMRDRDYPMAPPQNGFRIALLGASYVMGDGVGDNETFEWLVEERLAVGQPAGAPAVEILNFALPSYFPPRHLDLLHRKVFAFEPDVLIMVSHSSDDMDYAYLLATSVERGFAVPFDFLQEPIAQEGLTPAVPKDEAIRRLAPYTDALLEETYRRIVADSRARGIHPVWAFIPTPNHAQPGEKVDRLREMAVRAGFTIIDLSNVYEGQDTRALWLNDWDYHPNARGHALIADRLHDALRESATILPESYRRVPASAAHGAGQHHPSNAGTQ